MNGTCTHEKSVEQLGFKFSDIEILLGTHAPGDHQEGDALIKTVDGVGKMNGLLAEDRAALPGHAPGRRPGDKTCLYDRRCI